MSSSGAQSNHINHVQTQMQYAFVVIAVCAVGYLIAGFTENWWLTLLCSLVILTGVLLEIRKREITCQSVLLPARNTEQSEKWRTVGGGQLLSDRFLQSLQRFLSVQKEQRFFCRMAKTLLFFKC